MASLRSWFRGSAPSSSKASREPSPAVSASTSTSAVSDAPGRPALSAHAREIADLEDALASTALLLNDNMEGAEARLRARQDSSAFHLMGLGVSIFMRSVLGFEKEFMDEANARLLECETRAGDEMKKAHAAAAAAAAAAGGSGGGGGGGWLGRAHAAPSTAPGSVYPPGSEFALVHAQAQIMLAIVAELHETLTEAIRGFYKLRKAFVSLHAIIGAEEAFLRGDTPGPLGAATASRPGSSGSRRLSYSDDPMPGAYDKTEFADLEAEAAAEEAAALAAAHAAEAAANTAEPDKTAADKAAPEKAEGNGTATATTATGAPAPVDAHVAPADGHAPAATPPTRAEKPAALSLRSGTPRSSTQLSRGHPAHHATPAEADATHHARKHYLDTMTNPLDIFVHSGANMCFGLLLLLISMVPPAFSRLLAIVGFKGDRQRGVRMLWQSTKFANIYGGIAGLVLLVYYNGLVANVDILPGDADIAELTDNSHTDASEMEIVGYPRARCRALLEHMRALFPDSLLWVLEEARMLTADRRVRDAMAVLQGRGPDGKARVARMRQLTALAKFELAVNAMCSMEWTLMRESFLACVELNKWSHTLYLYNVACAELELYRTAFHEAAALRAQGPDQAAAAQAAAATAARYKAAAEAHFREAPTKAGRKKFMARQIPFDTFVLRKLARWEERARQHGVDLADAVGVSPAQEMAYLWDSAKKLPDALLEQALHRYLSWDRCTADAATVAAFRAAPDESGIESLCRATLLRALGRLDEAQSMLEKELLVHDRSVFKGPTKDDYVLPSAYYESGVIHWLQAANSAYYPAGADAAAVNRYRHEKVNESLALLEKVVKWESFLLDMRIGMKVQTGVDSIRWLKKKKKWA